jgi:predicted aldo/keto reductase-like oxidoreductase
MLHTDYFDVYQIHALSTEEGVDKGFGPGIIMKMMIRAKEKGVVRKVGVTCHSKTVDLKAMPLYDFDTVI